MNSDKLIAKMEELKRVETEVMDYPAGWNDAITKCIALVKEQWKQLIPTQKKSCNNCSHRPKSCQVSGDCLPDYSRYYPMEKQK